MTEHLDVVVIGGGQAGLATSHELTRAGVEHVVLERARIGQTWRDRWDSFCLVTPNWATRLPGGGYDGADPDGFAPRDDVVTYLERYADGLGSSVREGVEVASLDPAAAGGFDLRTSSGDIRASSVVVATGAYQRPHRPEAAASLPADLLQIDVDDYRNPGVLPSGRVLVVGSGQSGCQIAQECAEAGREVFLSCGRAPWAPRRLGDRDLFWWVIETGYLDATLASLSDPAARLASNPQVTGHGGGHDLNFRTIRAVGVTLLGHFLGAESHRARFADDLADSVAWGDQRYAQLMELVRKLVQDRALPEPEIPEPAPFDGRAPRELDLSGFGAVVFAGGFRPDYARWVRIPGAFDDLGFPLQSDGASAVAPGLFFVGVHFLRKRKSSLLYGVGEDAAIVADRVASAHGRSSVARGT
jgi:putative flavoprotein involved in K+ transport